MFINRVPIPARLGHDAASVLRRRRSPLTSEAPLSEPRPAVLAAGRPRRAARRILRRAACASALPARAIRGCCWESPR
eukprot:scaffold1318_cov388-Prasinococcus_capsulatus_cf.AAC.88